MSKRDHTRREFLVQSSIVAAGAFAAPQMLSHSVGELPARLPGLMVDAARVPESLIYYRRVIDFCADWQLNALQFRLADDQGCALRFSSVPDLYFHPHAFAPEQLHDLARYANARGVDLIPELESFGHTGYITRSAAYKHLLDADPEQSAEFTGVIPVHPETLHLFGKLYREVAEVFPSIYLHGGCDEVNWGGSTLSREALASKQRFEVWVEYLNALDQVADSVGKQFVVWGDMVVRKEPKILERLNKRIIVMDWDYTETNSARLRETRAQIGSAGHRAIGAPALISYRVGPRAGPSQLANIDAFADAYAGDKGGTKDGTLGVILTNWIPSRYIQNSIWDGFAYTAVAFAEGSKAARKSAFQRFVQKHYGSKWNEDWAEVFRVIYQNAPQVHEADAGAETVPLRVPWSNDEQLSSAREISASTSNPFAPLQASLGRLRKLVSKNAADFTAFTLCVSYLEHTFWRDSVVSNLQLTHDQTTPAIRDIAKRDCALAEALSEDWDQGRFSDSKQNPLFGFEPKDQLYFQFQRAADYSVSLASHPDRFLKILLASRHA